MGWRLPIHILEGKFGAALQSETWSAHAGGGQSNQKPFIYGGSKPYDTKLPIILVTAEAASPDGDDTSNGNLIIGVEFRVISSQDISGYGADPQTAHESAQNNQWIICGNLYEWLCEGYPTAAALSGEWPGDGAYSNTMYVKDIRLTGMKRGDYSDDILEDIIEVECYTYQTAS